jgi:hypothetical protein
MEIQKLNIPQLFCIIMIVLRNLPLEHTYARLVSFVCLDATKHDNQNSYKVKATTIHWPKCH